MEQIVIVGMQNVNFTDDRTRQQVMGTTFYFTQEKENVTGVAVGKMFVSNQKVSNLSYIPKIGDRVKVYYNRFGKPEDFELVPAGK